MAIGLTGEPVPFSTRAPRALSAQIDFRAIATGFEQHDANYLALVKLAASRIWMRIMSR